MPTQTAPAPTEQRLPVYALATPTNTNMLDRWYDRLGYRIPCYPHSPARLEATEDDIAYLQSLGYVFMGATEEAALSRIPTPIQTLISEIRANDPSKLQGFATPVPPIPNDEPSPIDAVAPLIAELKAAAKEPETAPDKK